MDYSLENYIKQQSSLALQIILSRENDPLTKEKYSPEVYNTIRKVLAEREAPYDRSNSSC